MTHDEIPHIGHVYKPTDDPPRAFARGLLDAFGELCVLLVARGVITAGDLQGAMEMRAQINRDEHSTIQALPAQTIAEVAALIGKAHGLAFPKDAQVIPLKRPGDPPTDPEPDGAA